MQLEKAKGEKIDDDVLDSAIVSLIKKSSEVHANPPIL